MKLFLFTLLSLLSGCGVIGSGSGVVPRDAIPQGTIKFTGNFAGQRGRTVTGIVSVYLGTCASNDCQWVVRIAGISTPQELPLQLIPSASGTPSPTQYSLRTYQGDQNYVFTAPSSTVWSNLRIYSAPNLYDIGTANLIQSGH